MRPQHFPSQTGYALVTGGATRIGAQIARRLAADGWRVVIHYRESKEKATALISELENKGSRVTGVALDLSTPDLSPLFARVDRQFGFCSVLVNSAAIFEYDDIGDVSAATFDAAMAVNLRAPIMLARHFRTQLPAGEKGLIINLLDQKVFNLNPDFLSYTLAKCALSSATELLSVAMAPDIRVCGIAPGLSLRSGHQTDEGFESAHRQTPLGFGSLPEDIAEAASFLTRMPAMTGINLVVDGGQHLERRAHDVMFTYGVTPDAPVGRKQ